MDNRSLSDDLSKLFSSENEDNPGEESTAGQDSALIERLKELSGNAQEGVGKEVNEFLEGKGALLESTRAAVQTGKRSAVKELAAVLADKFGLSSPLAQIVATLLVRLFPSISKLTGETTTKPKPRRKTKPKTSAGKKTTAGKKTSKRKTASSTKHAASAKQSASSKPKKRKTTPSGKSTTKKRKTTSSKKATAGSKTRKRRSSSRTLEIPAGEA